MQSNHAKNPKDVPAPSLILSKQELNVHKPLACPDEPIKPIFTMLFCIYYLLWWFGLSYGQVTMIS
jgi:hypothetical protein